jgi:hypothetical protein
MFQEAELIQVLVCGVILQPVMLLLFYGRSEATLSSDTKSEFTFY